MPYLWFFSAPPRLRLPHPSRFSKGGTNCPQLKKKPVILSGVTASLREAAVKSKGWEPWTERPPWGLNFDSPPAQSRKHRLFGRISRYQQIAPIREILLQLARGQITGFSQDFLILLVQLFPKEFHFL